MSRRTTSVRSGSTVDMEVANFFNLQNKNQAQNALMALRQRYKDEDLVNKIQEVIIHRHSAIVKSAKKFAQAVKTKYAQQNVPFHHILLKARAHAKKHHLSEAEFAEFQRIYEQELAGAQSPEVLMPVTNLMKVLGNINACGDNYFNVDEADYRNLQEILKLHESSKPIHAQCILQAIQYYDLATEALTGTYDRNLHNPGDHVHPVVAALFLPCIKSVDYHFLFSNISGIVKARYNRQPLTTRPDYELFYNLVTDPNDVVCDTRTPVGDLLHRCNLQTQLWNSVLHLRNGQYFHPSLREFMTAVDVCRLNKYDNPDLVYGRHDGTIIKRLFSAFSFRPTVVATLPVANAFAYNPYSQSIRPTVTSIPMINVRMSNFGGTTAPNLRNALNQTQKFIEGNVMVDRITQVMYSREILVFYVDRRTFTYAQGGMAYNVLRLPTSVAGFQRINTNPVTADLTISIDSDVFTLRSVVCADVQTNIDPNDRNAQHVVSSSTIIMVPDGIQTNIHYDPSSASKTASATNAVMNYIDDNSAITKIKDNGIIFIYVNANEDLNKPFKGLVF